MAGVGFELRRILRRDSYESLLRGYAYAGMISSGPWVLSILGVMSIGVLSVGRVAPSSLIVQFLVSVTYLIATSLIFTGALQLPFTRFVADRLFDREDAIVLPNLLGAVTLCTVVGGCLSSVAVTVLFDEPWIYRILMVGCFVTLSNLWLVVIFLAGIRAYRRILRAFAAGYAVTVGAALLLRPFGMPGLLTGFFIGQVLLLFLLFVLVLREYPGERLVAFDFLDRRKVFVSLAWTGFLFNAGIWADKLAFWFNPSTSQPVIGPLRASVVYDLPIFLAYLAIIPGMATFLVRIETDFAEYYDRFFTAVREGSTLERLFFLKDQMTYSVRQGVYEIFKVQGVTVILIFLWGERLLTAIGISTLYLPLFYVDLVAVSVQVLLLAILNVLFYLDERGVALTLSALFAVLNLSLTLLTQLLGPQFYGYGFAMAASISALTGLFWLGRRLDRLEYSTFMLKS